MIYVPGEEPIWSTNDSWQEWELYAVLMRTAELAGGEEE